MILEYSLLWTTKLRASILMPSNPGRKDFRKARLGLDLIVKENGHSSHVSSP